MQLRKDIIRWGLWFSLAGASSGFMLLFAAYLYLAPQLPKPDALREVQYQIPLRVFTSEEQLIAEFGEKRRTPVSYEEIPQPLIQALLAAEDERFFRHSGVDIKGLLRAVWELVRYQDIRSGGSTITMQVARNFFLDREQRFLRKFNEIVLALEIENLISKEDILALYLNKIYLGHRSYGAEAAAQVYYGKSLKELSLAQQAMIAGLPKAPSAFNPVTNPDRAMTRRNWILGRMLKLGKIDQTAYDSAIEEPNTAELHGSNPDVEAGYLAEMVRQEMINRYGREETYTEGMRVFTTLRGDAQLAAVASLREGLHEYDERHGWRGALGQLNFDELPELEILLARLNTEQDQLAADVTEQASTTINAAADNDNNNGAVLETAAASTENDEAAYADALKKWKGALSTFPAAGDLTIAAVIQVDELSTTLITEEGNAVTLAFDTMEWAAPYVSASTVGNKPESCTDILTPGEVVYIRQPISSPNQWRLAQLPEPQSALASLDPQNGAVRALVGGYSFGTSNFNRAEKGERQAGSSLKPFIYTAGLLNGFTPASLINDAPIVFDDSELETAWRPTGSSSKFYGPTRLREALYRSLNLVSIRLLQQVGISNAKNTLRDFGLPTKRFAHDLSLALGSASVTPLELAEAYSNFANGGFNIDHWFIERIEDNDGNLLWQAPQINLCDNEQCTIAYSADRDSQNTQYALNGENDTVDELISQDISQNDSDQPGDQISKQNDNTDGNEIALLSNGNNTLNVDLTEKPVAVIADPISHNRAIDERTIWLMDSMLKDVVRRGTAYKAMQLGRSDLAGKTGTTNEQFDAWFAGYSPDLVATVWVGFDNPSTLGRGEYGGKAALPIWMKYMGKALSGVPNRNLPQPAGIVSLRIDPESGQPAKPGDANAIFEYFPEESAPDPDISIDIPQDEASSFPEELF